MLYPALREFVQNALPQATVIGSAKMQLDTNSTPIIFVNQKRPKKYCTDPFLKRQEEMDAHAVNST